MKRKSQELRRWLWLLLVCVTVYYSVKHPVNIVIYHLFPQMRPALGQVIPGGRFEQKTPRIEGILADFRETWEEARKVITPDTEATLQFPDDELYIRGERAIAITSWDGEKYLTVADWRMLTAIEAVNPLAVKIVAVHEVCHLADGYWLKGDYISEEARAKLEIRANHCAGIYLGLAKHP